MSPQKEVWSKILPTKSKKMDLISAQIIIKPHAHHFRHQSQSNRHHKDLRQDLTEVKIKELHNHQVKMYQYNQISQ